MKSMATQSHSHGENLARIHTTVSNRRKAREGLERKPAFRYVLENPFHIQWSVLYSLQRLVYK